MFADIIETRRDNVNLLRKRIEEKRKILGTLVSLTDPCLCEIFGNVGYDCIWIDTEHTYMDARDVLCHLNAARSVGVPAVVRLPQNDLTSTKRVLEMGPDGVIFPMMRSADEIREAIGRTLYPPLGTRGFGPMRAIGYGELSADKYVREDSLELCRFVQLEHIDALNALDEIAEIPYVDGFIFGPNDLSGSLGEMLNVYGDVTASAIRSAVEILHRHGRLVGLAGGMGESDIAFWSRLDLDMIFAGGDWSFLYNQGKETLKTMKKHFGKE